MAHGWTFIETEKNIGFGAACNLAVDSLPDDTRFVLFLNPDASIDDPSLEALRYTALLSDVPALVAPIIHVPTGGVWFHGGGIDQERGIAHHLDELDHTALDWLTGACLLSPVDHFRALGGFAEDFFLYWEDVDLSYRWKRSGGRLVLCEQAFAIHQVGGTQRDQVGKSTTYVRYNVRNRLFFARRNLGRKRALSWLQSSRGYVDHLTRVAQIEKHPERRRAFIGAVTAGTVRGIGAILR